MMETLAVLLNNWAGAWAPALWRACWQGGLALLLVWGLCRLPRLSPNAQAWLWRLGVAKLLLALVVAAAIALPWLPAPPPRQVAWVTRKTAAPAQAPIPGHAVSTAPMPAQPAVSLSPAAWLLLAWLLGVVVMIAHTWRGWRGLQRLIRASAPAADDALCLFAGEAAATMGLHRTPALLVGPVASPLLVGVRRPTIILPSALLAAASYEELRLILLHECAHARRRDLLWGWLPRLGQMLFFFHPLAWLAGREWRLAHEMACDAAVLRGEEAATYGGLLVKIATAAGGVQPAGAATFAATYRMLQRRILAMHPQPTSGAGARVAWLAACLVATLAFVPWQLVQAQPELIPPQPPGAHTEVGTPPPPTAATGQPDLVTAQPNIAGQPAPPTTPLANAPAAAIPSASTNAEEIVQCNPPVEGPGPQGPEQYCRLPSPNPPLPMTLQQQMPVSSDMRVEALPLAGVPAADITAPAEAPPAPVPAAAPPSDPRGPSGVVGQQEVRASTSCSPGPQQAADYQPHPVTISRDGVGQLNVTATQVRSVSSPVRLTIFTDATASFPVLVDGQNGHAANFRADTIVHNKEAHTLTLTGHAYLTVNGTMIGVFLPDGTVIDTDHYTLTTTV